MQQSKREKEFASSSAPGKFPNPEDSLWSLGNVLPPGNYVILVSLRICQKLHPRRRGVGGRRKVMQGL